MNSSPPISYADSNGVNIAWYQYGSGPDILGIPPLCSNLELVWESPYYLRFLNHLQRHLRVTAFDKRGIGLSDKFFETPSMDQRVDDILAVMGAAGLGKVAIVGGSEGGLMAQVFAARHPELVERLVLLNPAPSRILWDELALDMGLAGPHPNLIALAGVVAMWGRDPQAFVDWFVPSYSADAEFVRWMGQFQRQSATPADITRQIESIVQLELSREATASIEVPTLIIHTEGDRVIPVEASRKLASILPNSELRIVKGDDHFGELTPQWREATDLWIEFVTGSRPTTKYVAGRGGAAGWTSLTVTERLVADLVHHGLTNRQIGERLGSSPRTVESHLSHIFSKLQISTRVELAAVATARSVDV